jgi:hypothetical protein
MKKQDPLHSGGVGFAQTLGYRAKTTSALSNLYQQTKKINQKQSKSDASYFFISLN